MKQFVILSLLFVGLKFFSACTNSVAQSKSHKHVDFVLTEEELFQGEKIELFLKNEKKSTKEAKAEFLEGLDLYKNKKDKKNAFKKFVKSILKEPTSIAYYELGNVLLDSKQYKEAIKAYGLSEQLGYEPFSKVLYNMACAYSLSKDQEMAGQYLEYAIQAGYSNIDQIDKDPDLALLRKNEYVFNTHLKSGLNGVSDSENLFWLQFKKQFSKSKLPLNLNPFMDKKVVEELTIVSYDFEKYIAEMRDGKFSREVSKGFYYYANVKETDKYVALIYLVKDEYMGDLAPVAYRLVTFTHDGTLIDKKEIAGSESLLDEVKVAAIDKNLMIKIDHFAIKYKKNTEEFGFEDNPIVSKELSKTEKFFIMDSGKIEAEEAENVAVN